MFCWYCEGTGHHNSIDHQPRTFLCLVECHYVVSGHWIQNSRHFQLATNTGFSNCLFPLLKEPKCEIFDRSDFHDFYTIKFLQEEGDFGVKIKKYLKKIFRGSFGAAKFLTRMLSIKHKISKFEQGLQNILIMRVRNWCVHWAYASGTDACTERTRQELMPGSPQI